MTKTNKIEDILMLAVLYLGLMGMTFGFVACCVFLACGIVAGIITTVVLTFLIGLMFGMELINML